MTLSSRACVRPISTAAWPAIWPLTSTSTVGSVKGIRNDGTVLVGRNRTSICGASSESTSFYAVCYIQADSCAAANVCTAFAAVMELKHGPAAGEDTKQPSGW